MCGLSKYFFFSSWLLYPTSFFKPPGEDVGIYLKFEGDVNGTCKDLPGWLDRSVGSYRFAGDPSSSTGSSLNLYGNTFYRNDELKILESASELPFSFNSLIRVGPERWQFFMKEGFEGFSECLEEDENYVVDFSDRFGVQAGDVKSIRMGCDKP
jgi:hypothetical protein